MPNLFGLGATTGKNRVKNQSDVRLTATPDGALYVADYYLDMALEGRVFNAAYGTGTTPAAFTSSLTAAQPSVVVDVPIATTIIPLRIQIFLETQAGALTEIVAETGNSNFGVGTSAPVTPLCTRTDRPLGSACSVNTNYSANGNIPTNLVEFWHAGYNFADTTGQPIKFFEWASQQNGPPQVIVGGGCLIIYVDANGNTAPTGFLRVSWIELPSSALS